MENNIAGIRKEYRFATLDEATVQKDPVQQFEAWWNEAINSQIAEPNAMTLATSDKAGRPSARIVLLKGVDADGFSFFTNYESRKGNQIHENPYAALIFFWKELERQVRVEGIVEKLSAKESDEYFDSRPEGSRIGAWASPQSRVITSREYLEQNVSSTEKKFAGQKIERPAHWGGYVVKPHTIEFWQGRPNRLHDRILFTLKEDKSWKIERLAP